MRIVGLEKKGPRRRKLLMGLLAGDEVSVRARRWMDFCLAG